MINDNLKNLLQNCDVVSFDVFDTLLIRPFIFDQDFFVFLEQQLKAPGFAKNRIEAEKKARCLKQIKSHKQQEDVSLAEIYAFVDEKYQKFQQIEQDFDFQTIQPNANMKEVFAYVQSLNKKIIIISDTYYSADFLKKMLEKNGFSGISQIFSSSDIGKLKSSGNLYQHVCHFLNVEARQILHIGDNKISDYDKAKEKGFLCYPYISLKQKFKETPNNATLLDLVKKYPAELSCILGMQSAYQPVENYWENLGYKIGGVLAYAFYFQVMKVAEQHRLSDVFFIARDCYILDKMSSYFAQDFKAKTHYVYVNRNLKKLYLDQAENKDNPYNRYIESLKLEGNSIGVADSCAKTFSAQIMLQTYLKEKHIEGIYLSCRHLETCPYTMLSSYDWEKFNLFNWNFTEFLLTSPEYPISDIQDNLPVYEKNVNEYERQRKDLYLQLYCGNMRFIADITRIFKGFLPDISIDAVFEYISVFWKNLSGEDKKFLSMIKHPIDDAQKIYISIVEPHKDLSQILRQRLNLSERKKHA